MPARLPIPGSDDGTWGTVLNDFLSVSLKTDGTVKDDAVGAGQLQDNSIGDAQVSSLSQSKVTNLTTDLAGKQPLDSDLTAIAGLSPANNDVLQRKSGAWTNRTPAQVKTDLAITRADISDIGAKVIVLNVGDPVPGGTAAGTVIVRI